MHASSSKTLSLESYLLVVLLASRTPGVSLENTAYSDYGGIQRMTPRWYEIWGVKALKAMGNVLVDLKTELQQRRVTTASMKDN